MTLKRTSLPNPIYQVEFHGESIVFRLKTKTYFAILPLDIYNSLNPATLIPEILFGEKVAPNKNDHVATLKEFNNLNGSSSDIICTYGYGKPLNSEDISQNICFKGAFISNTKDPFSVDGVSIFDHERMKELGV